MSKTDLVTTTEPATSAALGDGGSSVRNHHSRRTRFASYNGHSAALVALAAVIVLAAIQVMPA